MSLLPGRLRHEIDTSGSRSFQTIEPLTNYSLVRLQKDFNEGNTFIGAAATNTIRNLDGTDLEWLHKNATSGGVDFTQFFKDKNYKLTLALFASNVQGTTDAISRTQRSSARYFQRPDADYLEYDDTRTSLKAMVENWSLANSEATGTTCS